MRVVDLTGQKFGNLTVIRKGISTGIGSRWICKCLCGAETEKSAGHLKRKFHATKSCSFGCPLNKELMAEVHTTHGMSKHRAYNTWRSMMKRCYYPKDRSWEYYGGRGISVCKRWRESFQNFWEDMGPTYEDGLVIDRRNNDGNYTPKNCRWVTHTQNNRNRSDNIKGLPDNFQDIAAGLGFKKANLYQRIRKGLTWKQVLETPRYTHTHRHGQARQFSIGKSNRS